MTQHPGSSWRLSQNINLSALKLSRTAWNVALTNGRKLMALMLVYATVGATMPVRAEEFARAERYRQSAIDSLVGREGRAMPVGEVNSPSLSPLHPSGPSSDQAESRDLSAVAMNDLPSLLPNTFLATSMSAAVKPVLECVVSKGGGNYTAWFGYQNDNSSTVSIPVGTNNKFTPTPQDRGQTTTFQPGRQRFAYSVAFNGSNLVWTLKGPDNTTRTSTASSSSSRCVPVANAGSAQTVYTGNTVQLDGTQSYDSAGLPLTYQWSFVSKPSGSSAILNGATTARPTFVADKGGSYTVQLIVNNGQASSSPSTVVITSQCSVPVANPGPPRTVYVGTTVQLDGSASYDPGGASLSYQWSFVSKPSGSTASLAGANTVRPTFIADKPGSYTVKLVVCNGHNSSSPVSVVITSQYSTPVADPGSPQTVTAGSTVQLDGSHSSDPAGAALTYQWSFVSKPSGSTTVLSSNTAAKPTFVADKVGTYKVQLVVNNGHNSSAPATVTITSVNGQPVAIAGPAQTVPVGTTVQLDGTASYDPAGLPLTYSWTLTTRPSGSAAVLSNATGAKPSFVVDKPGAYSAQLIVSNGTYNSAPSTTQVSTLNSPPVANAGPNQTVKVRTTVQLDGSGSTDIDGDALTYSWTLSRPQGSTATLSSNTVANPTFVVDLKGDYVAQLVVNDGQVNSLPSTVTISTSNSAPVANAGPNQTITVTGTVHLDGSGSTDVDGDSLTYSWSFASKPAGSSATLSDPHAVRPSFVADVLGDYVLQLIVNDGTVSSDGSTVTITSGDIPPVARAGSDQSVALGSVVNLDGSASTDSDGQPLTYQWSLLSKPTNSVAVLSQVTSATPFFTADIAGDYVIQLIVNDGFLSSAPVTVKVSTINSVPVANAGPDQTVTAGSTVQLSAAGSSDADGDALTYKWALLSHPAGSNATLTGATTVAPSFLADIAGDYVVQLIVNDGKVDSQPDTVTITAMVRNQPPTVSAGPDQNITLPSNSVTLTGTASDDGLPSNTLTYTWTQISGPSGVVFGTPNQLVTSATFPGAGTYILQLAVSDSLLTGSATTTVVVNPAPNHAPVVSAGSNQTITLPTNTVSLAGNATDDGLPNGTLTILWSGPAGVVFGNPNQAVTTATFPGAGTYVLQLTANDSQLSSSANVTIVVKPAPVNQAPTVNAGPNQAITFPVSTVTLNGTATDDGLPTGTLTVSWTQISGPMAAVMSSPGSATTQVSFTTPGLYVFQLSASDTQLSTASLVTVQVFAAAGGQNQAPYVNAGPDQKIVLPATVQLNGLALDDGLPNGSLSTAWTALSGPGTVTFGDAQSLATTASFSLPGTYVLQLSASDSALISTSILTVQVGKLDGHGSNRGTDFWLAFPNMYLSDYAQPQLIITSDVNTSGTISIPGIGLTKDFTLVGGQATTIDIPNSAILAAQDAVENKAIHVTALTEITVYGLDYKQYATDGFLALSTNVLGTDYVVPSWAHGPLGSSELAIVAPYDATTVTITPSISAQGHAAKQSYQVILNQGRTYQLSDNTGALTAKLADDLTGTTITSDKPVAVLGANVCAVIPGWPACNHIVEEIPPTNVWGTSFITYPLFNHPKGDFFRILAAQDRTNVNLNGSPLAVLDRGGFYELVLTTASAVTADKPVLLVQYESSENFQGGSESNGDPSMIVVPPYEQYGGHYTIATPTQTFDQHFVNIVVPTQAAGTVRLDDAVLPSSTFSSIGSSEYSGAAVQISGGTHRLSAAAAFGVTQYGFYPYDTYGYQAGLVLDTARAGTTISLIPKNGTQLLGTSLCLIASVIDPYGQPAGGMGVGFGITGANASTKTVDTDSTGRAQYCCVGTNAGLDTIVASIGASSDSATVTWDAGATNRGPAVYAGVNQTINLPAAANLYGAVADDGLPSGSSLTTQWTLVEGPGTVSFANPGQPVTRATFSEPGTYTLRITASDSQLSATSDVTVVAVTPPPNQKPTVSAGPDKTITLPTDTVTLNGSVSDDGLPSNAKLMVQWTKVSGPHDVGFSNSTSALTNATFFESGTYVLRLTADDSQLNDSSTVTVTVIASNRMPQISCGTVPSISLPVATTTLNCTVSDDGLPVGSTVTQKWSQISGPAVVTFADPTLASTTATFPVAGAYHLRLDATDGELDNSTTLYVPVQPANQPPSVSVNPEYYDITLPSNSVTFMGSVSDDGLPAGSTTTQEWTQTSGPAPVTFSSPTQATTQATFTKDGTYYFQLSATDSQLTASARAIVTVHPANKAPVVYGGPDQTLALPASTLTLNGSVSDDGLPSGASVTPTWTEVSGPAAVVFTNPNAAVTQVTFTAAGAYVLRLSASDTQLNSASDVNITVYPSPQNQPPMVSAGQNQTATTGVAIYIYGSANDDGLPSGSHLSVSWSQLSGPTQASIANPTSAGTYVTFPAAGVYVLQLSASDSQLTSRATAMFNVLPPANQPPWPGAGNYPAITLPNNSLTLVGSVTDDGLPSNTLTTSWVQLSGPAPVIFADPSQLSTQVTFPVAGTYQLRLRASDGQFTSSSDTTIVVNPVNQGLNVSFNPSNIVLNLPNATTTLNATVSSNPGANLSYTWSLYYGPGPVAFASPNSAITDASFSVVGSYWIQLSVTDGQLTGTSTLLVEVFASAPPVPRVVLNTPQDGQNISDSLNIIGSVLATRQDSGTGKQASWILQYSLNTDDGSPSQNWVTLNSGADMPLTNASLGTLDPTVLLNGSYTLRLTATDSYGQSGSTSTTFNISKNKKLGYFTIGFNDLNIPVAGLPISITRSYDTRDMGNHDFGLGWSLGIANVRLEKNRPLGKNWVETSTSTGWFYQNCLQPSHDVIVTITFPDGKQYRFQTVSKPQCSIAPIVTANVGFVQLPSDSGTAGATLQLADGGQALFDGPIPGNVNLVDYNAQPYNPTLFVLTTHDGYKYTIDQKLGVTAMSDPNGNTLTINADGIISSTGKSITFTRDSNNHITKITDPNGTELKYGYSGNSLTSFVDGAGNTTYFQYAWWDSSLLAGILPNNRWAFTIVYQDGRHVSAVYDANGKPIQFSTDDAANTHTITDRLGNATAYSYDDDGNILSLKDALGHTSTYTYDVNDNKLSETNALGKTTTYTYDGMGNRLSEIDPLGNKTTYTYNARGQVLTVTDPQGHATTNVYDPKGNLTSTTDANGKSTTTEYYSNGQPKVATDANGKTTQFEYDGVGNLTKQTDALGNISTYTYDNNGNKKSQSVTRTVNGQPQTLTTNYEYDGNNRLTKTTYPDGTSTRTEYNNIGKQSAIYDQFNRMTRYDYDTLGRLTTTTYPDQTTETATYDAENHRLTSTDRAGHTTTYDYDALGRLTKTHYADGSFTETVYDAAGRVSDTYDALRNHTQYAYDDTGRRKSITDAAGHTTYFDYDNASNQTSVKDANQHTTQYDYDALNRQVKVTYPDLSFSSTAYDALGRVSSKTDQAGKVTAYGYDDLGRLTSVTQDAVPGGLNLVTQYGYDEVGNRISQTDANNHTTTYSYDKNGRRMGRTLPLGQSESYTYDDGGNLRTKVDFNGKTTTYAYDSSNRLLSRTPDASFSSSPIVFTYYGNGLRHTMSDPSGSTTYVYDTRNRLTSKQTPFGTLSYTYDSAGNLLTLKSSNAGGISDTYTYDGLNRLSTVTDPSGATTYSYDNVGNLAGYTYPNAVATSYTYDQLNRLTQMGSSKGGALSSYTYTLGPAGNRTSVAELSGRTVSYGYDALYRLTSETITADPAGKNGAVGYIYDAVGNRKQMSSTLNAIPAGLFNYNANDQLSTDTYDANGNTTSSAGITSTYDFENHLIQKGAVTVVYDGDGNRVAETVGGVTTNYLVDTVNPTGYAQVVEELQSGAVSRTYSFGLERISQRVTANGQGLSFYGYDGHGSVRNLTDSTGAVTDTYDYDAFGNLVSSTGTTPNVYLFAGEAYDAAIGLYYNRARYLNTSTGRFWSADSYEGDSQSPLSLHKYLYDSENPVDRIDPSGHFDSLGSFAIGLAVTAVLVAITVLAFRPTTQIVKQNLKGTAGVAAAKQLSDKAAAATSSDMQAVKYYFGNVDPKVLAFRYQTMWVGFSRGFQFKDISRASCGCVANITPGQTDFSKPVNVGLTPEYYKLANQYPAYDVMDHPNIDASEGGVMIHEMSHALFDTKDYAYYGNVPNWVQTHPSEGLDNADSYRLFAEHEYLH